MLDSNAAHTLPYSVQRFNGDCWAELLVDPYNRRVKLISFTGNPQEAAALLYQEAKSVGYGKVIVYVQEKYRDAFAQSMREEGSIPGFYKGETAFCFVDYPDPARAVPKDAAKADEIVHLAKQKAKRKRTVTPGFSFRRAREEDSKKLAVLYGEVFEYSYPTPLYKHEYLKKVIEEKKSIFYLAYQNDIICGAASLELNLTHANAEVTDCAIRNDFRGNSILNELIRRLEKEATKLNLISLYSLSRALVPGINIGLAAEGYEYYGRLVNNCLIGGGYEDMNIWQKKVV